MKNTILYIKHANSTFIRQDEEILRKYYHVKPYLLHQNRGPLRYFLRLALLPFFILVNLRSKMMITWFADYHAAIMAFMGKLLGMKTVIIAGGQEAVCYPELGKGVYRKKYRGVFAKYALRNASLILPNHESLIWHENYYYDPAGKKDGIRYYVPGIKTPMKIVFNGISEKKYFRDPGIAKDPAMVLTVGGNMKGTNDFYNKGFDLFIELARMTPDLNFTMIGINKSFLPWVQENHQIAEIKNLKLILFFCPDEVLFENYNKATWYIQASITEGMPNTLNEAMLCGCIPIGSDVNGIPDAIGDTGIIVKKRDITALSNALAEARKLNTANQAIAQAKKFSLENRERKMIEILEHLNKPDISFNTQ
jgi:glycosyltransferase involved in cell wall biosynthesis